MSQPIINELFKARKTTKQIADINNPLKVNELEPEKLELILEAAHWAPFHKIADEQHRNELNSIVPWRAYVLNSASCRNLLDTLKAWAASDSSWLKGKMPCMLASASAVIQVTWLPNPTENANGLFEANKQNMEHIAAASAAIQNMLLAATSLGIDNYWSSGGPLRRTEVFELLNIANQEIVLGSVVLFEANLENVERFEGAWRNKRGEVSDWAKTIDLNEA